MNYEPLRVTAHLSGSIIFDRPQPFDGILSAAIIESPPLRKKYRNHVRTFWRAVKRFEDRGHSHSRAIAMTERLWRWRGWKIPPRHFLPLAVWGHGLIHQVWVYCASWMVYDELARGLTYFNSHFDVELAERLLSPGKTPKIQTGKGEYKSEHIPFLRRVVDKAVWYVYGDAEAIEEILATVPAIAKKRNRGYGTVQHWQIEPMARDESIFNADGYLMRPVPLELLDKKKVFGEWQMAFTTFRPPYWSSRWVARCAVGGMVSAIHPMNEE